MLARYLVTLALLAGCAGDPGGERAPRPERIALSTGSCYGSCPSFDLEVDSSGTVRYLGRDLAEPAGYHTALGERTLYARLADLAVEVRADTARGVSRADDDWEMALVVWYGGEERAYRGTEAFLGGLGSLVNALLEVQHGAALRPSDGSYDFTSYDVLGADEEPDMEIPDTMLDSLDLTL